MKARDKLKETSTPYDSMPPRKMFTPASFAELLRQHDTKTDFNSPLESSSPPVVSFYGLKGGSGRSISLAYTAMLLARRGLRVGVIDFDFEAPGLHAIFGVTNADTGSLAILEDGNYRDRPINIWDSIETINVESKGKVLVMTAGKITADYLSRLDNLRPLLWDEYESQPIARLLREFKKEDCDIILVDCRTGFHGVTASILFHYSDLIVSLFPLSDQIWDGVEVLTRSWVQARAVRGSAPGWLIVPAMIPGGAEGKRLLEKFLPKLKQSFNQESDSNSDEEELDTLDNGVLEDGIPYHSGIAAEGVVPRKFSQGGPWGLFEPLVERIINFLDVGASPSASIHVDYAKILSEVQITAADGFAEELTSHQIEEVLVPSDDLKAAIDPAMAIVVGAKGSGKTLVWRCCIEDDHKWARKSSACKYVIGHAPDLKLDDKEKYISREDFKTIEKRADMAAHDSYEPFWKLYALYRLCGRYPKLSAQLVKALPSPKRKKFNDAMGGKPTKLYTLMQDSDICEVFDEMLMDADSFLADFEQNQIVLCYDGLDTSFQGTASEEGVNRRNKFVKGLLLMISSYRGQLHRILFKVFLREDIYISIEGLQNKSHMEAYKKEIRFQSRDIWRLALNLVTKNSDTYTEYIQSAEPGLFPPWDIEEERLKSLLYILWGRILGKGNKAITTNYIIKRTSDSQERLFPRTFIQMMKRAFDHARTIDSAEDRVLPHQSLTDGVEKASMQRTSDLDTEYFELSPYLKAMKNLNATFDRNTFSAHMNRAFKKDKSKTSEGEISKVLHQLETIGVLSKKERAGNMTWSVALMYRNGLSVTTRGGLA